MPFSEFPCVMETLLEDNPCTALCGGGTSLILVTCDECFTGNNDIGTCGFGSTCLAFGDLILEFASMESGESEPAILAGA